MSETGEWSLKNPAATRWCVCPLFEPMPSWVSWVCSALYCCDCFIFPLPELFLHHTVKTEGSAPGLIVNRVKQDTEVRPLNPHWASSEWHTWLVEPNGGIESFAAPAQCAAKLAGAEGSAYEQLDR